MVRLNLPTATQFADDFTIHDDQRRLLHANLLTNKGTSRLDISAFAAVLDEPIESFWFCDLSCVTPWVREMFVPHLRTCAQCSALGYHTVLFSLQGLRKCPLHGVELEDRCECGFRRDGSLKGLFSHPYVCGSCRRPFSAITSCRRPEMEVADTVVFRELGTWLMTSGERIFAPRAAAGEARQRWVDRFGAQWSKMLGLSLPTVLSGDAYASASLAVAADGSAEHGTVLFSAPAAGTGASPTAAVYGALNRYLRRHVLPTTHRKWQNLFIALRDAESIHKEIARDRDALVAWVHLLWCMQAESSPNMRFQKHPPNRTEWDVTPHAGDLDRKFLPVFPMYMATAALGAPAYRWAAMHASGNALVRLWGEVQRLVEEMLSSGDVYWGSDLVDLTFFGSWFVTACEPPSHNTVHLTYMQEAAPIQLLSPRARASKAHASEKARLQAAAHVAEMRGRCTGQVLIYEADATWRVATSTPVPPCIDDQWLRRHRLLGVQGKHFFVLFLNANVWIARHERWPLETRGETAREAISALRQATQRYLTTIIGRQLWPEANVARLQEGTRPRIRRMRRMSMEDALQDRMTTATAETIMRLAQASRLLRPGAFWDAQEFLAEMRMNRDPQFPERVAAERAAWTAHLNRLLNRLGRGGAEK